MKAVKHLKQPRSVNSNENILLTLSVYDVRKHQIGKKLYFIGCDVDMNDCLFAQI